MSEQKERSSVLHIPAGEGRRYDMGGMRSLFLADGAETDNSYSISEWWLDPGQPGPGAHCHDANDDIFYVIEGTMDFLVDQNWVQASRGDFIRVPAGVTHDFANNSDQRAGLLNIYIPGGFEQDMPAIVQWFREHQ
ncbi:cupin domain-containing protein [Microbulbifer taiwanensis]|uniref:Cupin domain-containing protein n=1 Tax=Microbulbifer taiwanensis TaxID=986746 RepID=A0ABW1YMW3_9GAMM|nr:cupin domain-containing protein [Microbulbifer taiwanensis]